MVKDTFKAIKEQLLERLGSPLLATFAVSWCVWNFEFFVFVTSSLPAQDKIDLIRGTVDLNKGFWYPLYSAAAFLVIYPLPALLAYGIWDLYKLLLTKLRNFIEKRKPITKEEALALQSKFYTLENEYRSELEKRDSEIERLKKLLEESNNAEKELENKYSFKVVGNENKLFDKFPSNYDKESLKTIFKMLEKETDGISMSGILEQFPNEQAMVMYVFSKLFDNKMAIQDHSLIRLTTKGRSYIAENWEGL